MAPPSNTQSPVTNTPITQERIDRRASNLNLPDWVRGPVVNPDPSKWTKKEQFEVHTHRLVEFTKVMDKFEDGGECVAPNYLERVRNEEEKIYINNCKRQIDSMNISVEEKNIILDYKEDLILDSDKRKVYLELTNTFSDLELAKANQALMDKGITDPLALKEQVESTARVQSETTGNFKEEDE